MEYRKMAAELGEWDVIVCGAGPSGIAAAVSARRMGARVMLLERYGSVGGCLTQGMVSTIMGSNRGNMFDREIRELLGSVDGAIAMDSDAAKGKLIDLLDREGVEFRLQTPVADALLEDGVIRGVFVLTQKGLACMRAKRVIDATGDGYVAAMAGAEVMFGRDGDGRVQPASLMYVIDGVDERSTLFCNHEEHYTIFPDGREYLATCKKAAQEGRLPENVTIVRLYEADRPGERLVNATQANGISILHDGDIERAEVELRRQMEQVNRFLREEIPGFENIRTRISASALGVRESRRIRGRYVLRAQDLVDGRIFEDCVVHGADFPLDIHNPSGGGQSESEGCPQKSKPYDIPMRALQPLGVENLIVTGRCISGSHRAHASYRVMNIAMGVGQAAGVMAAVSVQKNQNASKLEYEDVRDALLAQGCVLSE